MKRTIIPVSDLKGEVLLSGSKYLANRWVVLAALAEQPVTLNNVVNNDDISAAVAGLNQLGYHLTRSDTTQLRSEPRASGLVQDTRVFTHHSGTFSRFVSALAALEKVSVTIAGSDKMNTRPMADLFRALRQLGVKISANGNRLPAIIHGPIKEFNCVIDGSVSSQYISALLLIAPKLAQDFSLTLTGKAVSTQYIDMTLDLMAKLNVAVTQQGRTYRISAEQNYSGGEFTIAPDPVSSSYFLAAPAIAGGQVTLQQYDFDSLQGEAKFYQVLKQMGCELTRNGDALTLARHNASLQAVDVDMGDMPDVVQTLAVVACFAEGTTVMRNIAHLAFKESDRIKDTARELQRVGAQVEFGSDYLAVTGGGSLKGAIIETYDDHRMAMSMALLGTKVDNITINHAEVVAKSFPDYFDKLASIGIHSQMSQS